MQFLINNLLEFIFAYFYYDIHEKVKVIFRRGFRETENNCDGW